MKNGGHVLDIEICVYDGETYAIMEFEYTEEGNDKMPSVHQNINILFDEDNAKSIVQSFIEIFDIKINNKEIENG